METQTIFFFFAVFATQLLIPNGGFAQIQVGRGKANGQTGQFKICGQVKGYRQGVEF